MAIVKKEIKRVVYQAEYTEFEYNRLREAVYSCCVMYIEFRMRKVITYNSHEWFEITESQIRAWLINHAMRPMIDDFHVWNLLTERAKELAEKKI